MFTLITFIFTICVVFTITSFREVPLGLLERAEAENPKPAHLEVTEEAKIVEGGGGENYGTVVSSESGEEAVVSLILHLIII